MHHTVQYMHFTVICIEKDDVFVIMIQKIGNKGDAYETRE